MEMSELQFMLGARGLSATFVVVAVIMSDVIALLVRLFVVTVESEGTIPNAACQRRKVLALRLLSILHYVLPVLLPHFHQIYKMQEHLCSSMDILCCRCCLSLHPISFR